VSSRIQGEWVIAARFGPVIGRYHGGAYIDLYDANEEDHLAGAEPIGTINVWDHAAGQPAIESTPAAVLRQVAGWVADYLCDYREWDEV